MKVILGLLMVFGVNAANADAVLCDNEVVIQAVQKVMESIDADSKSIAGLSVAAEQPVNEKKGLADAEGKSVDSYKVGVKVSDGSSTVSYLVELSVEPDATKGTCDYIKKTTKIVVQ